MSVSEGLLECGRIINTHGVRGEVKISPWSDTPEFLLEFGHLFVEDNELKVASARVSGRFVYVKFEGYDDISSASSLKNKDIFIRKSDVSLPEGRFFLVDAIGLEVYDVKAGFIGKLEDYIELPSGIVFVVRKDGSEHLIPDVSEFIKNVDVAAGRMDVTLIDGM